MITEIKHQWTDAVLFSCETESKKLCLEAAVKSRANLVRARLDGAHLVRARLVRANLDGANLVRARLVRARLEGANLVRAHLEGANLNGAHLVGANLDGAHLVGARLDGANLVRAHLDGTVLDPSNIPNQHVEDFSERDGEWVIGYRTRATSAAGLTLQDDRIYGCEVFSTADTECHPGWYLWPTLDAAHSFSGQVPMVQVKAQVKDIHRAGTKWRSRAIWVIGGVE